MGTTAKFLKLRSSAKEIKLGQWHNGFSAVKKFAEDNDVPFVAVWTNGDKCGSCVNFEEAAMNSKFKNWMKASKCAFWFGYYGDTSKDDKFEGTGFTWCYNKGKVTQYPFVRIYWKSGKVDATKTGSALAGKNVKAAQGAANLVANISKLLENYKPDEPVPEPDPEPQPEPTPADYKTRFNEKLTVAKINAILDAIDKCEGYCPCQPRGEGTKCHCEDFVKNKGFDEPCICNLYVKKQK